MGDLTHFDTIALQHRWWKLEALNYVNTCVTVWKKTEYYRIYSGGVLSDGWQRTTEPDTVQLKAAGGCRVTCWKMSWARRAESELFQNGHCAAETCFFYNMAFSRGTTIRPYSTIGSRKSGWISNQHILFWVSQPHRAVCISAVQYITPFQKLSSSLSFHCCLKRTYLTVPDSL